MTRWIDATPAQRAAITQRADAKRKESFIANIAKIRAMVAEIEAEAQAAETEGGRFAAKNAARIREEKTPYIENARRYGVEL